MAERPRTKDEAIERNYAAFREQLPTLLRDHEGQYALIRDGKVVDFFDDPVRAEIAGQDRYPDGLFSFQEVTARVENLGFYTYALS